VARALAATPRWLPAIALLAAAIALVLPSATIAGGTDLLLALLVLLTALGIPFAEVARLRDHAASVLALSVLPLVLLAAIAWALSRSFAGGVRDGLIATGLSSSEVASVGLVALAGADTTIALGAVTGSLVAAAVLGPIAIGWLGGGAHVNGAALLARFALVVLVPLAIGVALRSSPPLGRRLGGRDAEREGLAALTVAVLVYAALSGAHGAHDLGPALLASAAFLTASALLAAGWHRLARRPAPVAAPGRASPVATARVRVFEPPAAAPGAFAIAMRDFAVAAALATQAFGSAAGTVPGVYGVLMLVAGSAGAGALRRRTGPRA
jgi:predicted Na+-dependent transporter